MPIKFYKDGEVRIFKLEIASWWNCLKPVCAVSNFNKVTTAATAFTVINPGYDAFAVQIRVLGQNQLNATNKQNDNA